MDYTELDDAIVNAVKGGAARTFHELLLLAQVKNAAKTLEMASPKDRRGERKPAWRFVDTRLQALRRRGVLKFDRRTGWALAEGA